MIGTIIAQRYRVDSLLGTGGMANVYKAYDMKMRRLVALKVLKPEFEDDAEFLRRFSREAHAVLSLSHENIVRSYDVGHDDKLNYIVLEYVEGVTLKKLIRASGPLIPKQAVSICCQMCDALSAAHDEGIIHRDVKPQNIIITPRGKAKLADFGIARDAKSSTQTFCGNNVMGSVHYISPEQAQGEAVTRESDIYSLGIVLYEMLTGKPPFDGDNTVSIAIMHLQQPIQPPMAVVKTIPPALSHIVMRATAKSPEMRYKTTRQMKRDLQRALREPAGTFAIKPATQAAAIDDAPPKKRPSLFKGSVLKLALILVLALGLMLAMFFTVRTLWDRSKYDDGALVPKLIGKTIADGAQTASIRGYSMEVVAWVASEEIEQGIIVDQSPAPGTSSPQAAVIAVTASSGSMRAVAPSLVGLSINEINEELAKQGLELGEVEYEQSDEIQKGLAIRQNPLEGQELVEGDAVDVVLSGPALSGVDMPIVMGVRLTDAIKILRESGFASIRIRPVKPDGEISENIIMTQQPPSGVPTSLDTTIELSVCNVLPGKYMADVVFNADIAEKNTPVMVCVAMYPDVELVIYEGTAPKGVKTPIAFQAVTSFGGEYEAILYIAGEKVRTQTINFEYRK